MNRPLLALLPAFCLTAVGCTPWIANQIVSAPGPDHTNYITDADSRRAFADNLGFEHRHLRVGPPEATIAATIIHPGDYGLEYDFHGFDNNEIELDIAVNKPARDVSGREPAKGTVIILPGMLQSRYTMTFWGIGLAERGYRAVLLDLRGHGESTGRYLTYGLVESRDTLQVIETLASEGVVQPPVVLLGASYGAATALMAAARSDRIEAVAAFAPFTDAASSIEHMARTFFPYLSWALTRERLASAMERASRQSGSDITRARAIDAVDRIQAPLLFVHGQEDTWVPPRNSFALYRAAEGPASLFIIPGAGHMDLPMRYEEFSGRVFDWLDEVVSVPASSQTVTTASGDGTE